MRSGVYFGRANWSFVSPGDKDDLGIRGSKWRKFNECVEKALKGRDFSEHRSMERTTVETNWKS